MEAEQERSLETFLKWATKQRITDSSEPNLLRDEAHQTSPSSSCLGQSLLVSHFPDAGGRGLAAARDLVKHELVLKVPKSALITRELLLKDQNLSRCVLRYPHLSSTQILSVCLLAEMSKGKCSCWSPYLMQLPRRYHTLASFTRFETQALQVDFAIWAAEKAISKADSEWRKALPLMQELELKPQLLTFRSWLWASATISSRTMHIPWDDAGCLCPVGDFFNYAAPGEESFCNEDVECWSKSSSLEDSSLWKDKDAKGKFDTRKLDENAQRLTDAGYEEDVDAYCFYARTSYRKGDQILLSYGTYTNLELLEHYGFLLNVNPNEKAFIQLESDIYSNSWPKDSLYLQQDGKPSFTLLSALRLWVTPPNHRKSVGHLVYSGLQLSAENEISVMKWLRNNCIVLLDRFPSSIDKDFLLLNFIDKMDYCSSVEEVEQMLLACGGEARVFFEANGFHAGCNVVQFPLSRKTRRSMERWKLAVQWRLRRV